MPVFANIKPTAQTDGILYANATPLTAQEADLWNTLIDDPVPVLYNQSVEAIVLLAVVSGPLLSNTSYVIMQTDNGDGVWVDVAGIIWKGITASAIFSLSGGAFSGNAIQQTRNAGIAPAANFSNQIPLGGRIRFVGSAAISTSSSSSSSSPVVAPPGVTATIRYKFLGLR